MSSYVVGPFELEERRLRGVVNQCQADLVQVMGQMEQTLKAQAEKRAEVRMHEREQREKQEKADHDYRIRKEAKEEEISRRRENLRSQLKQISEELLLKQEHLTGMERALERHSHLESMLEAGTIDFDQLEVQIESHRMQIMQEMRSVIREQGRKEVVYEGYISTRKEKAVSLKMGLEEEASNRIPESSPKDIFEQKLQQACESRFIHRFPSVLNMEKAYHTQSEGMRNVFALRNMEQLDQVLKKLSVIQSMELDCTSKREQVIKRYRALCQMLHEKEDERLIQDPKAMRSLNQRCEQMFHAYQAMKKKKYVSESIAAVMERHGIIFQDSEEFAMGSVMHFQMDHAVVDISGTERDQLIMEVSGQYSGERPTLNDRRRSVESASHLCSMMNDIERELQEEYGIIFGHLLRETPEEKTMVMRKQNKRKNGKRYAASHLKVDSMS